MCWFKTHRALLGLDERAVLSVHFVVQAAGVAQVVAVSVASPQRRRRGAAVDALTALCRVRSKFATFWIKKRRN